MGCSILGIGERIIDTATGRTLPPNTDGEVWIKGPIVMWGYYNLPAETGAGLDQARPPRGPARRKR